MSTVEQLGDLIGIEAGAETIVLRIQTVAFAEPKEVHTGRIFQKQSPASAEPLRQLSGRVIGYLIRRGGTLEFQAQDWRLPVLGASAYPLTDEEGLATIGGKGAKEEQIPIGRDSRNPIVEVRVNINDLLGRHLAILGATGQGKTHFVAALLQSLSSRPNARIVVFDVNGEYGPAFALLGNKLQRTVLGTPTDDEVLQGVSGFRIPYYALGRYGLARLLLPSERAQMPALRFAVEHLSFIEADERGAKACGAATNTLFDDCRPDNPQLAIQHMDQIRQGQARRAPSWPHMRGLSCLAAEWYALRRSNKGVERDSFHYSHLHSLINRIRSLIEDEQFQSVVDVAGGVGRSSALSMREESRHLVTEVFGPPDQSPDSWNVHILDLRRLTQDLMPFVLGSLLELFAAELFHRGTGRTHPTLLALEEAHHYLRQLPTDAEIGQHALAYERLAKEGRKFGLSLLVSTQRPSEVSPTVLAQCGTWAVFRLINESDQKAVGAAAEAAGVNVTRQLAGLARGDAMIFGAAVSIPSRISVIRPHPQPDLRDPPFVTSWGPA